MRNLMFVFSLLLILGVTLTPCLAVDDLAGLSDEFEEPGTFSDWKNLSTAEGWPNRIEKIDINSSSPGHLYLVPLSAAWWSGYHGVYLFKMIKGDFMVTARLMVTGKRGDTPATKWTISGLLVRTPGNLALKPTQRLENWIYQMFGTGPDMAYVIDSKSTTNSYNVWNITPARAGWVELRIVRIGASFISLYRFPGEDWVVRNRHVRTDMPEALQVGLNATSDFDRSRTMDWHTYNQLQPGADPALDSVTRFDYVRLQRPDIDEEHKRAIAKDPNSVSEDELLRLFGG